MSTAKGHFGGYVRAMDESEATIEIDNVTEGFGVSKGDMVKSLRSSFMAQMPCPSVGNYAEGNVVKDAQGNTKFINVIRPV